MKLTDWDWNSFCLPLRWIKSDGTSMQNSYQVLVLGNEADAFADIRLSLGERLLESGFLSEDLRFLRGGEIANCDRKIATIALFFGGASTKFSTKYLQELISDSIIIIPIVTKAENFSKEIPEILDGINAIPFFGASGGKDRIVSLVFEIFGLLRRERKIFISYKRSDSQEFANLLYDELDKRGFDVFIDVRSVPPAEDFQAQLWHRMADCDVVVLIDTPGFKSSRWTMRELTQANATNIQILHVLWPGQKENPDSALSHFFYLRNEDFEEGSPSATGKIMAATLARICEATERIRARAMAARHRYLVDNFCDAARTRGFSPAVQPQRWISMSHSNGENIAAVPAVGVPTAEKINNIFDSMQAQGGDFRQIWMIYDNRGLLKTWLKHLDWLHQHLPIKAVKMSHIVEAMEGISHD